MQPNYCKENKAKKGYRYHEKKTRFPLVFGTAKKSQTFDEYMYKDL